MSTWLIAICTLVTIALAVEVRTSRLQSFILARYAAQLTYDIGPGPSSRIVFPSSGPHDQQLGYTHLPEFTRRLLSRGFGIAEQAQMSEATAQLASFGITPPYREKSSGGLVVRGASGTVMFDARPGKLQFERYEDVPPLVVDSLLFIEDRELLGKESPRHNPAFDGERLSKAWLLYIGRGLGMPLATEGGSTLATQIEKLRHSPGGRTSSPLDKLRQVTGASLKAYQYGPDTRAYRRDIVVDYLNSMPLAALPNRGEVRGLGEGLQAWFGLSFDDVQRSLLDGGITEQKVATYKAVLALLCAVREPTRFLVQDRAALEQRVDAYTRLLGDTGVLSPELAERVGKSPLHFRTSPPAEGPGHARERKAVAVVRTELLGLLNTPGLYDLDRLDVEVGSTIDVPMQSAVRRLLTDLRDPEFIAQHALTRKHLLAQGNPADVTYTVLLYEATPEANLLRVHADTLDQPFDLNMGMKMGLGSTAKLRTLAHYLEVLAQLHAELTTLEDRSPLVARDPLTAWSQQVIEHDPAISVEDFLRKALEREYPAEPRKVSFAIESLTASSPIDGTTTGSAMAGSAGSAIAGDITTGSTTTASAVTADAVTTEPVMASATADSTTTGIATPGSTATGSSEPVVQDPAVWYIPRDLSLRTALVQSSNRVFVNLMRDLVRYHAARLPYDADAVMTDPNNRLRRSFLEESADQEALFVLRRAYRGYQGLTEKELVRHVLRGRVSARRAAVLFYAWHGDTDEEKLAAWLADNAAAGALGTAAEAPVIVHRIASAYGNPRLTIADYGYLLDLHPLEIWCAKELVQTPGLSFEDLMDGADGAKVISSQWLFQARNRRAQDLRVKRRIERDAFAHMTPYWRQMGFPFERLVPSLTTALGTSSDRPAALAELMGIIVNDGWRRPSVLIDELRFANDTPYFSDFRAQPARGEQVMHPEVARLLRNVLAEVVESGTGRGMKAAITGPDGVPTQVGGKTGTDSGDTRHDVLADGSRATSPRVLDRTASFAFYVGDRYYGVITASVRGQAAAGYAFTSELPLAVLRQLAPLIERRLATARSGPSLAAAFKPGELRRVAAE